MKRLAVMVTAIACGALLAAPDVYAAAIVHDAGCTANTLVRNDDGSTGLEPLGLSANFLGTTYTAGYVNNNGNITFTEPLDSYTPGPIAGGGLPIIAPFWADVDTLNPASAEVKYGQVIFAGRPAFCATWDDTGVGYYSSNVDKLNKFQVLLVDRSDVGPGDFDIAFNYDQIQWETGDASDGSGGLGGFSARAGFSDGNTSGPAVSFEFPGSAVNGAFLDSNVATGLIHSRRNSSQDGRYVFAIRNGAPPGLGQIDGDVTGGAANTPVAGGLVQVCRTTGDLHCLWNGATNASGHYQATGIADGSYSVYAYPPAGSNLFPGRIVVPISNGQAVTGADIHLVGPTPPPAGTSISPSSTGGGGIPVAYWTNVLTLRTTGCPGGTASYAIQLNDGGAPVGASMTEGPAGTYTATVPAFFPRHGQAHVRITIVCPGGGGTTFVDFDLYIDPSGVVHDTSGNPISSATVTLYRSDTGLPGTFTEVPNGSGIMSPSNRANPSSTDATGHFGWDVVAGYYRVRAQMASCHAPGNAGQPFVETGVLTIAPPVLDLDLMLECPAGFFGLTVAKGGTGFGRVTATGIDCGTDCFQSYSSGTPVTLTATAGPGSVFAGWSGCTSSTGATCNVTMNGWKTATASFTATPTFADVPPSNPFYNYIEQLFDLGITTGCGTNGVGAPIYCPNDSVPRQQMAAFLIRAKGLTQLFPATPSFTDVPASNPFFGYIERLKEQGITTGCNPPANDLSCPVDSVPRQQMAAFIIRAKGLTQLFPATPSFTDVPASNPFFGYIERLKEQGITTGCNPPANDLFCPVDFVPRQQMAAFIIRAKGLTQLFPGTPSFLDVPASNPFFGYIERLKQQAITTGCNPPANNLYCPVDNVPRQQMAAFLVRAFSTPLP